MRKLVAAVGIATVVAGSAWAIATPASAAPEDEKVQIAACQHRVCVYVLNPKSDRDGDGVTDIDEIAAGTNPDDRWDYPDAPKLIDMAINGELPSFRKHLTEIVVLPTMTPDKESLATGFGAFALPAQAWLANDPRDGIAKIRGNGYSNMIGQLTDMLRPEKEGAPWGHVDRYVLISAGDGSNSGKAGTMTGGRPEFTYTGGIVAHSYTMDYPDKSRDVVIETAERTGPNTTETTGSTTSFDGEGNKTGHTSESSSTTTDPKSGETTSSSTTSQETFDPKSGAKTGSSTTVTETTTKDGVRTSQTTTTYYDADGNVVGEEVTEAPPEQCPNNKCPSDGYYNSEYIAPGPITGEDFERVVIRLNWSRTPGPDNGSHDPITSGTPSLPKWPLVALMNPDGVVVLATSFTPRFNVAQPEYDPRLQEMAPLAGIAPPVNNENGTTSWPSGDPNP